MIENLSLLASVVVFLLLIPVAVFLAEVLFAFKSSITVTGIKEGTAAIIIPAHNESLNLIPTLQDVRDQIGQGDRVIVVADNCTDDTAKVALGFHAEVLIRNCPKKRGKSFALDWGVRHLGDIRPDTIIIVDADCRLGSHALQKLKQTSYSTQRPVQALYLMEADATSTSEQAVGRFAWLVKNKVRPLGLRSAGLPCQLMGTGMAFPEKLLARVDLASGHLAEDICLGLACARAGYPPLFQPDAFVHSKFAKSVKAVGSQRRRWEHGHLQLILTQSFPLLLEGILKGELGLIALSLDLFVPPITLLGFLLVLSLATAMIAWMLGGSGLPLVISLITMLFFATALTMAWIMVGRRVLPFRKLLLLPWYALEKAFLYVGLLSKGFEKRWVRTERK